jgi:subtilisin family serine protease
MRLPSRRSAATALMAVTAALAASGASPASATSSQPSTRLAPLYRAETAIPGHYIVGLRPGSDPAAVADGLGATPKHIYRDAMLGFAASLTDLQVARARSTPAVISVEEDGTVAIPPNERAVNRLRRVGTLVPWGLKRINQRAPGGSGYAVKATGANVSAYIIDTGIDYAHPEFGGRAVLGTDQMADGRRGADCAGHGTHVAGTVGGTQVGVAKKVTLVSVRVLDCENKGSNSGIIAGINWVAAKAKKPAVANISLSGTWSLALNSSIDGLARAGVFPVVAAGNASTSACVMSPSGAASAFTVAATDQQDAQASFSNYGSCVELSAPGVAITSAYVNGAYADMSGTSMAAPHVTGIAALYLDTHSGASSAALSKWLTENATPGIPAVVHPGTPRLLAYTGGL